MAVVIVINIVSNNTDVIFFSAANNHGNQLAADIKSGEDAENRDQSELVHPDINCLGVDGYIRLLVGMP